MDALELRIGNLIYSPSAIKKIQEVVEIRTNVLRLKYWSGITGNYHTHLCSGIQLTEDILIKAGFKFDNGIWNKSIHDTRFKIEYAGSHCQLVNVGGYIGEPFQYLHQLMNLYSALTGTELETNL